MLWANLLHLGYNMWEDREVSEPPRIHNRYDCDPWRLRFFRAGEKCAASLFTRHSAFERHHPPYQGHHYSRESCSHAEAILETGVMLPVNEAFTAVDAEEVASDIRRVALWFVQTNNRHQESKSSRL